MKQIIKKIVKLIFITAGCLAGILLLAFMGVFIFAPDLTGKVGGDLSLMMGTKIDSVYVDGLKAKRADIVDWSGKVLATGEERTYPYGELAKCVIGTVPSDDEDSTKVGIEGAFNRCLSGKDGYEVHWRNLKTGRSRKVRDVKPRDGATVPLSLDIEMQALADSILRSKLAGEANVRNACLMIADVSCSGIRAMVNLHADEDGFLREGINNCIGFTYSPGMMMAPASAIAACRCDSTIDLRKIDLTIPADLREMYEKCGEPAFSDTLSDVLKGGYCDDFLEIGDVRPIMCDHSSDSEISERYARMSRPCGFGMMGTAFSWLRFYNGIARGGEEKALVFAGIVTDDRGYIVNDQIFLACDTYPLCTGEQADILTEQMRCAAKNILGETKYEIAGLRGSSFLPAEDGRYHMEAAERSMQTSFAGFFPADSPKYSIICMVQTKPSASVSDIPADVVRDIVNCGLITDRINTK